MKAPKNVISVYGYPSGEIIDIPERKFNSVIKVRPSVVNRLFVYQERAFGNKSCFRFLDKNLERIKETFRIS
jgi:hypothetical protein